MKLAASNIAWTEADDEAVASLMVQLGYEGLEIAPTRVWADPLATGVTERLEFRRVWERRGLRVVAMQALVFGRPNLRLFGEPAQRQALLEHLSGMIGLAADLGAHALVFGSPKNRSVGQLSPPEIEGISTAFFGELGMRALERGVTFCIEPNPVNYGCDFVTTVHEALPLVKRVANAGFGLHLDAGGMTLSGDALQAAVLGAPTARHFHASEPHLVAVGSGGVEHAQLAEVLRQARYGGWVSVEMRPPAGGIAGVERSLALVSEHYRGAVAGEPA